MLAATDFPAIWLVDFEFHQPDGERPQPLCLVAHEWRQKRTLRYWLYGRPVPPLPPYPCDRHSLFVAYYASAELSCHLAMQWPLPVYVLWICSHDTGHMWEASSPQPVLACLMRL